MDIVLLAHKANDVIEFLKPLSKIPPDRIEHWFTSKTNYSVENDYRHKLCKLN